MKMTGMWRTEAPIRQELLDAHVEVLNELAAAIVAVDPGVDLRLRSLELWVEGVEWRWEPMPVAISD